MGEEPRRIPVYVTVLGLLGAALLLTFVLRLFSDDRTDDAERPSAATTTAAPVTVYQTRTLTPTITETVTVTYTPPPPPGPATTMGTGLYLVGDDIQPGTYRSSGGDGCYWARLAGLSGELSDVIANSLGDGPQVVTISGSDVAFESERCGTWEMT